MKITMPRGDIRDVRFTVLNNASQTPSDIDFDEIYVTFKANTETTEYLFQKKLSDGTVSKEDTGVYQFRIEPEDTDGLKAGRTYAFDIELIFEDAVKQTTVGTLELTPEVTFAANE